MKILVSRIHGGSMGGAERSAYDHYRVFGALGLSSYFYTNAQFENEREHFVPQIKPLRWLWLLTVLPCVALFGGYDIINPHSREDQIAFTLSKWLHRTPVVWKDPGDLVHNVKLGREGLLGRLNQWLLVKAIKESDAIYTLNKQDKGILLDRLKKLGQEINTEKIYVVPSDILFADYDLKAKPVKSTENLVIGTIIRLDEHKGVQYLLEAAQELNKHHRNLEFWIVGDGPYRQRLESMAKHIDNVTFWGYQTDVSPYLAGMDTFVQPAEFEGWGRNVKEAMYFSKPIVGSDVGGIAEQIDDGKTGLLFEPKNVSQLTKQLEKLIKDSHLRGKLGQAGHKKALAEGDYVKLIKTKILPIFKSVINK